MISEIGLNFTDSEIRDMLQEAESESEVEGNGNRNGNGYSYRNRYKKQIS